MKILFCTYHWPPAIGGVERQSALLVRGLASRGHEVVVLTAQQDQRTGGSAPRNAPRRSSALPWRRRRPAAASPEPFAVHDLPVVGAGALRLASFGAALAGEVLRARRWADVVHVQQALPPAALVALLPLRPPLVVANHGSGASGAVAVLRSLPLGALALRALRRASLVALTDEMASEMRAAGLPVAAVIPNGVEMVAEASISLDAATGTAPRELILYAGRLGPEKDLPLLQEAAALLQGLSIDVLGEGPARLAPPLRLHGAAADVSPWLRRTRIFVLPSRSEGVSMALLEAMAHGCACVATDVGGNRAVLEGVGLLVPPGDAQAMASAIEDLARDGARAAGLGAAARARARERYSADAMIAAYERLYESLVRR